MDAADLCWSPNGSCIAVQDSVLTYKVFVMRPDGQNADVFRCVRACGNVLLRLSCQVCACIPVFFCLCVQPLLRTGLLIAHKSNAVQVLSIRTLSTRCVVLCHAVLTRRGWVCAA